MLAIVRFLRSLSYIFSSCLPMAVQIMFPVGMRCTYFYWVMIVETLSGREEAQQIAVQPTGSGLLNTARSGIDSCCFALFDMTREKPFRPFPEGRRRNQLIGPHLSLIRPQPPSPRAVHVLHRFSSNCLSWISTFPIQSLASPIPYSSHLASLGKPWSTGLSPPTPGPHVSATPSNPDPDTETTQKKDR